VEEEEEDDNDDDSGCEDDDDVNRVWEFKYLGHLTSDHRNVEVELEGDHWSHLGFKNSVCVCVCVFVCDLTIKFANSSW
jgi:hypothetical protein